MADNTELNSGAGGDIIATDDIAGVKHQQVKIEWGIDGVATPVSAANPLPVTSVVTGTVPVTQSGTWDEVGINDSGNSITIDNAALSVTGGGLEAGALRVTLASDSTGVLSIDDNGGSITVDGTFWQATQPVSGTVTAAAQPGVDIGDVTINNATLAVTQSGTWDEVGIHDSGNSITVDGTFWQATQPVSGTVAVSNITACNTGAVVVSSGTITTVSTVTNLSQLGGVAVSMNTGVRDTGTQRVTIATNDVVPVSQSGTWDEVGINDSGNSITIDNAALSVTGDGPVTSAQRVVIADMNAGEYETVAASQTGQVLGATGATGDWISGILVVPATTSPGNVLLLDNATSITVFTGGASSVSNLVPFFIPLGMKSVSGAWKVTTGANVSCIGIGNFTA